MQHPRHKKERKFIWQQVVLHIHILFYKYIYFYNSEAFYCLEIQSQRFTAGKLSSCCRYFTFILGYLLSV